jgi:hypothetical protein
MCCERRHVLKLDCFVAAALQRVARMKPTGRANARPMMNSAQGAWCGMVPDVARAHPGYAGSAICGAMNAPGGGEPFTPVRQAVGNPASMAANAPFT